MPPGQGDQCIYCQLIDNPQQLNLVGETENFYAWLEVQPRAKGHTQVVPKEHIESVTDFSAAEYQEAMGLVREVIQKAMDGLGADGASVTMNINESGGQMMPHVYISVFPRFEGEENAGTPTGAIFQHKEELQDQDKLGEISETMSSVDFSFGEETKEAHQEAQRFKEKAEEVKEEAKETDQDEEKRKEPSRNESFEWV